MKQKADEEHQSECLENRHWLVQVDRHSGALTRISHPADAHGMNWISESSENPAMLESRSWGLGDIVLPGRNGPHRWQRAATVSVNRTTARSTYNVGAVQVTVTRRLRGRRLEESYEFRNTGEADQQINGIGICTPFNDNYPDAETCLTRRCNAHLWCGGNTAYACCLRMGGQAPHMGLVLSDGYIGGYSIEGRGLSHGGSNNRGCFVMNIPGLVLQPGQTHRVAWVFFWHDGWEDFFAAARTVPAFLQLVADHYTCLVGERPRISASQSSAQVWMKEPPTISGEQTVEVQYGEGRRTWLRLNFVDPVETVVRRRVDFIRQHQQVNRPGSPYDGALVCYDNESAAQLVRGHRCDFNEGRERVGMGVLLTMALGLWPDEALSEAVRRYNGFVRSKLQKSDGTVLDQVGGTSRRLYNFPWVAQLHLEMFRALGDEQYLEDCYRTLRAYYQRGGGRFYPIGLPIFDAVDTFRGAGMRRKAGQLEAWFADHADNIAANGACLPAHEVNYEQTIVSPAVIIALEAYLSGGDERYLTCARQLMPALEAFGGRQPDHRLHEIAIRHWDGYWFGKRTTWGDTFPHYWSASTGWAFYRYWQATGDEEYRRRAGEILMNNLSHFHGDGSASCAYIYPDTVNGEAGRFADPLANDQDWALVFLLQAGRLDPEFADHRWGGGRLTSLSDS